MLEFLIVVVICAIAVWQCVEILHHSEAGRPWRNVAEWLSKPWDRPVWMPFAIFKPVAEWGSYIGKGMSCPFCYSNWLGILFAGCYGFTAYSFFPAIGVAFVGGMASARLANMLNDWMHYPGGQFVCRTPNVNPKSASAQIQEQHYVEPMEETSNTSEKLAIDPDSDIIPPRMAVQISPLDGFISNNRPDA